MRGHLGAKVSALLDGQLDPAETERAWAHVHACHACRDLVEREGWVKTRLAGLALGGSETAPDSLKGALRGGTPGAPGGLPPGDAYLAGGGAHRGRRTAGAVALGGGAVGAAVLGVVALGLAPADVSQVDRRAPITQIGTPAPRPTPTPGPSTGPSPRSSASPAPTVAPLWQRGADSRPQAPALVRP